MVQLEKSILNDALVDSYKNPYPGFRGQLRRCSADNLCDRLGFAVGESDFAIEARRIDPYRTDKDNERIMSYVDSKIGRFNGVMISVPRKIGEPGFVIYFPERKNRTVAVVSHELKHVADDAVHGHLAFSSYGSPDAPVKEVSINKLLVPFGVGLVGMLVTGEQWVGYMGVGVSTIIWGVNYNERSKYFNNLNEVRARKFAQQMVRKHGRSYDW